MSECHNHGGWCFGDQMVYWRPFMLCPNRLQHVTAWMHPTNVGVGSDWSHPCCWSIKWLLAICEVICKAGTFFIVTMMYYSITLLREWWHLEGVCETKALDLSCMGSLASVMRVPGFPAWVSNDGGGKQSIAWEVGNRGENGDPQCSTCHSGSEKDVVWHTFFLAELCGCLKHRSIPILFPPQTTCGKTKCLLHFQRHVNGSEIWTDMQLSTPIS